MLLNGVSNEKFGGTKVYANIRYGSGTVAIDVFFSFEHAVFPLKTNFTFPLVLAKLISDFFDNKGYAPKRFSLSCKAPIY